MLIQYHAQKKVESVDESFLFPNNYDHKKME